MTGTILLKRNADKEAVLSRYMEIHKKVYEKVSGRDSGITYLADFPDLANVAVR